MNANLSTVEHYAAPDFARTGFPFTPWLNESMRLSEEPIVEQISQVPQHKLPPRLKRELRSNATAGSNGLGVMAPSTVLRAWVQAGRFDGLIIIPDAPFVFPPQQFTVSSNAGTVTVESHPNDSWPQILVELSNSINGEPTVQRVQFRPSGNTVESEILYTRVHYTVSAIGSFLLASEITSDHQVIGISFNCEPLTPEQASSILYRAKIARKLRFIERIFNVTETLPEDITAAHVQYIEAIFRGLTEGEFTTRGNAITVMLRTADLNLDAPPFSDVGPFQYYLGSEQALLFQPSGRYRVLDVGPYYLKLNRAVLGNSTVLPRLRDRQDTWVRFEVLDSQVTYRYEKYADQKRHKRVQEKLKYFHYLLSSEEPAPLSDTLRDPLISDVLPDEAMKIGIGWLEYHNFPDRFSPQEPVLDKARHCWKLPIFIVYASGKNAHVGELLIDLKSGSLIEEPSPEEMYQKGLSLGDKILRAG